MKSLIIGMLTLTSFSVLAGDNYNVVSTIGMLSEARCSHIITNVKDNFAEKNHLGYSQVEVSQVKESIGVGTVLGSPYYIGEAIFMGSISPTPSLGKCEDRGLRSVIKLTYKTRQEEFCSVKMLKKAYLKNTSLNYEIKNHSCFSI